MGVIDIQRALQAAGFDPGPLDGLWGRRTIAAVGAFQAARGLAPDGIAGPLTLAALGAAAPRQPVWIEYARSLLGTREVAGPKSNPRIVQWAGPLGIRYAGDDLPWCGLFVGHCIAACLPREPLPGELLTARRWLRFGRPSLPLPGAVLVFWRGSPSGWQGHVGFYVGEDKAAFHVLGGNQSDGVSIARIARDRLLQAREPLTAPALTGAPVLQTGGATLSRDEA